MHIVPLARAQTRYFWMAFAPHVLDWHESPSSKVRSIPIQEEVLLSTSRPCFYERGKSRRSECLVTRLLQEKELRKGVDYHAPPRS
nr:hypothetical protein CFP56_79496 [Quercus suber]